MKKSIKKNAILNVIKNVSNILFPLITFPYVSRILSVTGLGQYNFAVAFVNYFVLIASFGSSNYAVSTGTAYRDNKQRFSRYASGVFYVTILASLISYLALGMSIIFFSKLQLYFELLAVFSVQILMTTLSVEWIYSVYEDYAYITIRNILFKIISLLLMFAFVRNADDVFNYAAITVVATTGSALLNLFNSKKYWKIQLVGFKDIKTHFKPMCLLFLSSVAVTIYVVSDTTMLGLMKDDYVVGIYAVSSKIYTIFKTLLSSLIIVAIPQLAEMYERNEITGFRKTVQSVIDVVSVLLIPIVIGMFLLSEQIVLIISGRYYIQASSSLRILSLSLLICIFGWIFNQCVLLPARRMKTITIATALSAVINLILNFLLIPVFSENAAAFTTLIAEILMFLICFFYSRKIQKFSIINRNIVSVLVACIPVALACIICRKLIANEFICVAASVIASVICYFSCLIVQKNNYVTEAVSKLRFVKSI